jgi:uncharacterized membrane protein (Fun14 family)
MILIIQLILKTYCVDVTYVLSVLTLGKAGTFTVNISKLLSMNDSFAIDAGVFLLKFLDTMTSVK